MKGIKTFLQKNWRACLRWVWWLIVLGFPTYFLSQRLALILDGKPTQFDLVIVVIWFGLLLAPLFSEVNVFGFKLKQEWNRFKEEISREVTTIRADIRTSITNQLQLQITPEWGTMPIKDLDQRPTVEEDHMKTAMEKMILNTLWVQQVNYYPDYSGVWTFRIHANTPVYLAFRDAGTKLIKEGLISETNEGQYYLTKLGFDYCKEHYKEFPPDRLYPEILINNEKLKIALGNRDAQ